MLRSDRRQPITFLDEVNEVSALLKWPRYHPHWEKSRSAVGLIKIIFLIYKFFVRNLGDDKVIHVDYENHGSIVRNFGDNEVMHMDYEKHGSVVRNLGCEDAVNVDFENYGPVVRNLGNDYVFHVY